jgi:NAD(P)-dependent dehydrogenase (short-subunit alcohol dehydrogenase family)
MGTGRYGVETDEGHAGLGRLKDKVAIVFGAGSVGPGWGNGKAAAVAFAREGAHLIAVDRVPEAVAETRQILRSEGLDCLTCVADVTASEQVKSVIDTAVQTYGRIDVLQNVVGATIMGGPVELSEDDWQKQLDVNLTSCFLTCKHTLPVMERQGQGAITNVSSLAAIRFTGYPYIGYYAAKGGVNQFTVGLALQYAARGIRVNAILPGMMNTPLIHQQIIGQHADTEAMMKARDAACPTGKMGTAWDIAYAAVFLASDEAKYITGVLLSVDGGLHCRVA